MSDRDGFQPGVPCWVDTWQADADAAADFYAAVLGWECVGEPGGPYMCRSRGRDAAMIAQYPPEDAHRPAAWMAYVQVDDLDAAATRVRDAGGSVPVGPIEALDGGRIAIIADPDGGHLGLWQLGRHRGAQVVNEPGAWSWAQLHSRDPEAVKRFYDEVFGWQPEPFGELTMFRLAGYEGGEPEQPVPRDVVAGMQPLAQNGMRPHWRVDFWVKDLDAALDAAHSRCGTVLAEPYDAGPFRQAVIADAAGAAFSASQLMALS